MVALSTSPPSVPLYIGSSPNASILRKEGAPPATALNTRKEEQNQKPQRKVHFNSTEEGATSEMNENNGNDGTTTTSSNNFATTRSVHFSSTEEAASSENIDENNSNDGTNATSSSNFATTSFGESPRRALPPIPEETNDECYDLVVSDSEEESFTSATSLLSRGTSIETEGVTPPSDSYQRQVPNPILFENNNTTGARPSEFSTESREYYRSSTFAGSYNDEVEEDEDEEGNEGQNSPNDEETDTICESDGSDYDDDDEGENSQYLTSQVFHPGMPNVFTQSSQRESSKNTQNEDRRSGSYRHRRNNSDPLNYCPPCSSSRNCPTICRYFAWMIGITLLFFCIATAAVIWVSYFNTNGDTCPASIMKAQDKQLAEFDQIVEKLTSSFSKMPPAINKGDDTSSSNNNPISAGSADQDDFEQLLEKGNLYYNGAYYYGDDDDEDDTVDRWLENSWSWFKNCTNILVNWVHENCDLECLMRRLRAVVFPRI